MKRKIGMIIGYNGSGYHGLQYNKGLLTVEGVIIDTLLENGCVTEMNSVDPKKMDMKSCSRTDKGVHASFNVVSVKIIQEVTDDLVSVLRRELGKKGILLHKIVRLPKRFIGHKAARSRVYKYVVPTYFLQKGDLAAEWQDLQIRDGMAVEAVRSYPPESIVPLRGHRSESIEAFREIMGWYAGTRSYHNFTNKSTLGNMQRHMKQVTVSEPFYNEGIEYIEVVIHGQSFVLHQIRKMISFAVLVCKYARSQAAEHFERVFSKTPLHVPKCPSQYLFLSQVYFDDFNMRQKEKGGDTIEIDEAARKTFEDENIYPAIMNEENLIEWHRYLDAVRFHCEKMFLAVDFECCGASLA